MQSANFSNFKQCAFDATSEMLEVYSHFFPTVSYFSSVNEEALTVQENILRTSVLRNFAALEDEYERNLNICFGECAKVRPLRALKRPELKHPITLMNAWTFTFDAFGSVDVFLAGLGVRVGPTQEYVLSDLLKAKERVLCSIRELYLDCDHYVKNQHMALGDTPEYAFAVVRGIDSEGVLG